VVNGYDRVDLCRPWNERQRPVLPPCLTLSADVSDQTRCRRYVVFQQYDAASHRVKDTIKLLQQETLDFVGPDLWPPNSSYLNPVLEYKVWGVMQQRVYECCMSSDDELKQRLVEVWNSLQQNAIDVAINE